MLPYFNELFHLGSDMFNNAFQGYCQLFTNIISPDYSNSNRSAGVEPNMPESSDESQKSAEITLSAMQNKILENFVRQNNNISRSLWLRAKIISRLAQGSKVKTLARRLGICPHIVRKWRFRWLNAAEKLGNSEKK